jgi:signal transduction histidine kinase
VPHAHISNATPADFTLTPSVDHAATSRRNRATSGRRHPTSRPGFPTSRGAQRGLRVYLLPVTPPSIRQRATGIAIVAAVVLLQVASQYVNNRDLGRMGSVLLFVAVEMPPLMLLLTALFDQTRKREPNLALTVIGGIAVSGAVGMLFGAIFWFAAEQLPDLGLHLSTSQPLSLLRAIIFGFTNALGHFGLWTLAFALPMALQDARVRSIEAEQLRVNAELASLRSRLEPHFLLNTLNAIAGLVTEDVKEARRLLVCLGDLLRDALHEEDELQTLDKQLEWLKRYAEILETRHRGSLKFRWEIDPGSQAVMLPRLLLQPLVENAVTHGALRRGEGGEVIIRTAPGADSTVVCTIEDNGPGMPAEVRSGAFGLQSVRRRLELRYANRSNFTIESSSAGTRTIVQLPRTP